MARRRPYTRVTKPGFSRPAHVEGMGDKILVGYQCLNPNCTNFMFHQLDELDGDYSLTCEVCGHTLSRGGSTDIFDYQIEALADTSVIESGKHCIAHDDYLAEAARYKYCLYCSALLPLDAFDQHSARQSGRQGECRLCKAWYNGVKNQTRLAEQHREASQRRRLYGLLSGQERIDIPAIHERFGGRCFKCHAEIRLNGTNQRLDHTLPAKLLWPYSTDTATLLCDACNGTKTGKWPSEFYSAAEIRGLSRLTSIPHDILAGPPSLNPDAVATVLNDVDKFIEDWIAQPDDIRKVRRLIMEFEGVDMFDLASTVPAFLKDDD